MSYCVFVANFGSYYRTQPVNNIFLYAVANHFFMIEKSSKALCSSLYSYSSLDPSVNRSLHLMWNDWKIMYWKIKIPTAQEKEGAKRREKKSVAFISVFMLNIFLEEKWNEDIKFNDIFYGSFYQEVVTLVLPCKTATQNKRTKNPSIYDV